MTLTADQNSVAQDLAKFIISKGIQINSPEDLDEAFRNYLANGSAAHFYLHTADDHQKKQFIKQIAKNL